MTNDVLTPDARFRLRTLFVATAMCAVAFAVMAQWRNPFVWIIASSVPGVWLGQLLMTISYALRRCGGITALVAAWLTAKLGIIVTAVSITIVLVAAKYAFQWAAGSLRQSLP